jgi:hypothetical protein
MKEKATNTKESVVSKTQAVREFVGGKKAAEVKTEQGAVLFLFYLYVSLSL